MNTSCKNYDTRFIEYLSLKELKQLKRYIWMLKLSNDLMPLAAIGYVISIVSILIKYVITSDITLSIESFIVPQVFAYIVLIISIRLGRYCIDKIEMLKYIGRTRCSLLGNFVNKINSK